MGQALYRKHRSRKLSEIVGQEHITTTLEQALKQGRISHAYLFTGPRGVGKTSIARILAHEINGLPYADDSSHIDIIEIDAASNRRIDEIRELREKVHIAPTSAKYKVYIIDEVHMLTREAFNALLKTLEEPPAHVVFILATTDAHKLPETIISRTQRFSFKPADQAKTVELLSSIAKSEKIKVSPEALGLIAEHSGGSFRDSVSLLDQASSHGQEVERDDIQQLLGIPPAEAVQQLLQLLVDDAQVADVISSLASLYSQGYQAAAVARQLGELTRSQLINDELLLPTEEALTLLGRLIEVPTSQNPERFLEIALLQTVRSKPGKQAQAQPAVPVKVTPPTSPPDQQMPAPVKANPPKTQKSTSSEAKAVKAPEPELEESSDSRASQPAKKANVPLDAAIWPDVLAALKQKHNTLYGVVRMAQPRFQADGTIELAFAFAFHQKRLQEAGNRQKLADTVSQLTGQQVAINCVFDKDITPSAPAPKAPVQEEAPEELAAISNIFGGGELLES